MTLARTTLFRLAYDARGTELAEAAVVLPLVLVMLIAVFWFGQAFRIYDTITHAAREGARAAVAPVCATCPAATSKLGNTPTQNVVAAVNNALIAAHLDPSQIKAPTSAPVLYQCGTQGSACGGVASCDSGVTNMCIQTNVQLSSCSVAPAGSATCGTSVSFRYSYPYHFTLPCWPQPCTSLDLSKISLPAEAQMRLETQ